MRGRRQYFIKGILIIPIIISTPFLMEKFVKLVYGPEFIPAGSILNILSVGLVFMILYKLITPVLVSKGRFTLFMHSEILVFAILAFLSFLLIPVYGTIGAAVAYIVGIGIGYSLLFVKGIRSISVKFPTKMMLRIGLASLVFTLFIFLPLSPYQYLFASAGLLLSIYIGLLFLFKVLTKKDVLFTKSLLRRKEGWK